MAEIVGGDIFFEIIDPLELEYTYRLRPAKDFGPTFNESFQLKNTLLVPAKPIDACDELENIDDVERNVVLIERGSCSFKRKTIMAEKAGARAAIITDLAKGSEEYLIEMIDDETLDETHIPAGFLVGKNGLMITNTLNKLHRTYAVINLPVNLTFTPVHQLVQPPWIGW
ncbi:PRADC1-like protein isoform X2 [Agrilus planipennis]|nr:PRADC1-like protein isoform X2 [Agrilus planipennis]